MFKKLYSWMILPPLMVSLFITVVILTFLKFLPDKLPLFYSIAWGERQLATHQQFLIIPACIAAVTFLNLVICWQLHPSQSFFKKTLCIASLLISLILTISFIRIILNFI